MPLTKKDKSLLSHFAESLWGWIKGKTATSSSNGMMSKEDKVKLDSINIADTNGLMPCEIGCEGDTLLLYTKSPLPQDAKVVLYHYVRRRQKFRPQGVTKCVHRIIKGWRYVGKTFPTIELTLLPVYKSGYDYRYQVGTLRGNILQTAIKLANIPDRDTMLTSSYFRQRMAVEVLTGTEPNTKPITRRLEFMMDCSYDDDGLVVGAWFCKTHQRTAKPAVTGT